MLISCVTVAVLRKRTVLDVPNDRSMHKTPTPRGGGLGIVVGFFLPALCLVFSGQTGYAPLVIPLLVGGLPIAAIGYIDDRGHIAPKWRAMVHVFSCGIAFALFLLFAPYPHAFQVFGAIAWLGCATLAAAYFLNVFNFMDGLDGLAGSEAVFASLASAWLLHSVLVSSSPMYYWPLNPEDMQRVSLLSLGLAEQSTEVLLGFACLGFLFWNWPPARIFMGDVGSGFLGFALAFLALCQTYNDLSALWPWLILLGVFVVDGTYTLIVRFATGQKWYEAHNLHAFQKAAKNHSHLAVTLTVLAINVVWLLPLAFLVFAHMLSGPIAVVIAYVPLIVTAWRLGAGVVEGG